MKMYPITFAIATYLIVSCSLLSRIQSTTIIKPKDSFILGNNEHGRFKVKFTNISQQPLELYHAPLGGGRHSGQMVNPGKELKVAVDRNTALVIYNPSADTVQVQLVVTGDTGLSMGYKNQ